MAGQGQEEGLGKRARPNEEVGQGVHETKKKHTKKKKKLTDTDEALVD